MKSLPRFIVAGVVGLLVVTFVPVSASAVQFLSPNSHLTETAGTGIGRKYKGAAWHTYFSDDFQGDVTWRHLVTDCRGSALLLGQEIGYGSKNVEWTVRFSLSECWTRKPLYAPDGDSRETNTIQLTGKLNNGLVCASEKTAVNVDTRNDGALTWYKWGWSGDVGPMLGISTGQCNYDRWQFVSSEDVSVLLDRDQSISGEINLGAYPVVADPPVPTPPAATCASGTPTKLSVTTDHPFGAWTSYTLAGTASPGLTGLWTMQAYHRNAAGNVVRAGGKNGLSGNPQTGQTSWTSPQGLTFTEMTTFVGVQIFRTGMGYTYHEGESDVGLHSWPEYGSGVTDASKCVFWIGSKIWSDGQSGIGSDEPFAAADGVAHTDPPPVSDWEDPVIDDAPVLAPDAIEECTFTLADPSTWLSGGMCSAVGLLGALLSALLDLVAGVLGLPAAFMEAVGGLFTPDQAVLNASQADISDSWQASSVGEYFAAFGTVAGALNFSTSGCSGPELAFTTPFGGHETMHPMSACSGAPSTVAAVVKAGLTLGVYVGAALIALRLLGASFGLNMNGVGRED